MARTFKRRSVSSSGGGSVSSASTFERGCLTILAVGKAVSGELAGGVVAETTLGFIYEVLKLMTKLVRNTSNAS